jgi:NADPH:quinone reductase-like Zn-dependent oxidoreductase
MGDHVMKAWHFERYGAPDVMELTERPMPGPGPGEVLIKVLASGINPSDVKNVSGLFKSALPRVPGRDFAGVVVAGAGREGEEVWGSAPGFGVVRDGTHSEYIVMPAAWVGRKPASLDMAQAAAIGVPYLAAWSALVTAGRLQAGETVLITGVAGAVGRAATQIAHWRKARVIGAGISQDNPAGADAVIDTTTQDLPLAVRALTGGEGADLALDVVGGALFEPVMQALRKGGRQIAIASSPQVVSFNLVDFYHGLKHLAGVDTMSLSGEEIVATLMGLVAGFEQGALTPPSVRIWPFAEAVPAYEAVARGAGSAKQVLVMT